MKTFVIGDIHGAYKAMIQVLERAGFNKEEDTLISLGDIADGWSEVPECVEYLLSCKKLIAIRGNHDNWCKNWFIYGHSSMAWISQGGRATIDAYIRSGLISNKKHQDFFQNQINYYIDDQNRAFIHGGYSSIEGLGKAHGEEDYYWDRSLWSTALSSSISNKKLTGDKLPIRLRNYKEIFIGHTATVNWDYNSRNLPIGMDKSLLGKPIMTPMNACNVWNLDTGGGFYGKITVMDVDTKEYWQSDLVKDLYPNEHGR